jgi:catechol 2,3-dioxygenase-like lactoylglutathione lyase family enzyme
MDSADRNTTVTARAGYARAVTARTELVLSEPEVNHNDVGSGMYFQDPDGHLLEIITRPCGSPDASS